MDIICNVCREPITNPAEQIDRLYQVRMTNKPLPPQKKHDVCDAQYAAEKTGLEKVN
jgi:hypothetical protein